MILKVFSTLNQMLVLLFLSHVTISSNFVEKFSLFTIFPLREMYVHGAALIPVHFHVSRQWAWTAQLKNFRFNRVQLQHQSNVSSVTTETNTKRLVFFPSVFPNSYHEKFMLEFRRFRCEETLERFEILMQDIWRIALQTDTLFRVHTGVQLCCFHLWSYLYFGIQT